ncbi:MAG: hypothetical protein FWC01_08840 [Treponema sp.]|nr:hypothetical protein [Treponema sp.]MCL2238078.1 hypothetical protein [Treponema sp.]
MKKLTRLDNINVMEKKIPQVLRARDYRLYLSNGKRLVDLWLNGGAAVLGHTPANLLRELKNTASRGLYAPFPHFTEGRFIKALSRIFPGRSFRLYAAPPQELNNLFQTGPAKLWRPYVDPANPFAVNEDAQLLVPVISGIQTWRGELPFGLCVAAVQTKDCEDLFSRLPPSDPLPPVLLALAARGIHDILAAPERAKPKFPRLNKALQKSQWQRQGIYLNLKKTPSNGDWEALFNRFLEAGFLLPTELSQPLILPGEMSDGEEAKLAAIITDCSFTN